MFKTLSPSMPSLYQKHPPKVQVREDSGSTIHQPRKSDSFPILKRRSMDERNISKTNTAYNIYSLFSVYYSIITYDTISDKEKDRHYEALKTAIINQYESAQTKADLIPLEFCAKHYSKRIITDLDELKSLLKNITSGEHESDTLLIQYLKVIYYLILSIKTVTRTDADDTLLHLWQECLALVLDTAISHQTQFSRHHHYLSDLCELTTKIIHDSVQKIINDQEWFNKLKQQSTSLKTLISSTNTGQKTEEYQKQNSRENSSNTFELIYEERSILRDTVTHQIPQIMIIPMQDILKKEVKQEEANQHWQISISKQADCEDTSLQWTCRNRVCISHMLDVTRRVNRQGKACQIILNQIKRDGANGSGAIASAEEHSAIAALPDSSFPTTLSRPESPTSPQTTIGICLDDQGRLFGQTHIGFLLFIEEIITKEITEGRIQSNHNVKIIIYQQDHKIIRL